MYLLIHSTLFFIVSARRFTSHYVSINSYVANESTVIGIVFTSHYVSINSNADYARMRRRIKFTSHYVSINSNDIDNTLSVIIYLHPTMYLLIQNMLIFIVLIILFTSHYVSINSYMF